MKRHMILTLALAAMLPVHTMAQSTPPENPQCDGIMQSLLQDGRFTTFAALLKATGYDETLNHVTWDEEYSAIYETVEGLSPYAQKDYMDRRYVVTISGGGANKAYFPDLKRNNFTVLAETDEALAAQGVKGASDSDLEALMQYVQAQGMEGDGGTDYRDAANAVNRWVGYHILPAAMNASQLVVHYNELGCVPSSRKLGVNVSEYYATLGTPARLLKFTEGANTGGIRVNRFSRLNATDGSVEDEVYAEGLALGEPLVAQNYIGSDYVYPITSMLDCAGAQQMMGRERLRFDVASLVPEMIAARIRRPSSDREYVALSKAFSTHLYADDMLLCYLPGTNSGWANMQGDEFNIGGKGSVTLQLPPAPVSGEYELRVGVSASARYGVVQYTLVADDGTETALGLPVDLRQSAAGWKKDGDSPVMNMQNDMLLRAQGAMKAPASYTRQFNENIDVQSSLRNIEDYSGKGAVIRRVVGRMTIDANRTYHLKMTNVISSSDTEMYLDYIELCPTSVCDDPEYAEDIW